MTANEEAREAAHMEFYRTEVNCMSAQLAFKFAWNAGVAEGIRQARAAMTEEWAGRFYSPGWYAHPEPTEFLGPIRKTREEAERDNPRRSEEGEWRDGVKRRFVTQWTAIDALEEEADHGE